MAWSYDRLPEYERFVLRRLSVFLGTFPFDAAKAIVLEGGDTHESLLAVMNELVARSLLAVSVEDCTVVYRLLETTRVYAREQLIESGEFERMSLRHAMHFVENFERAVDLANVRAALKWGLSSPSTYTVDAQGLDAAQDDLLVSGILPLLLRILPCYRIGSLNSRENLGGN